ncbi:MAG TPA: glycosyltransferase family 4 protein [Vicinamibacterales bacterium]|nr:glycosyltransferase family 4 protein [Vicinamibacterales bacterium]
MTRPCLAAITLDPKGGGVAVVSRLLWRVFSDRWGDQTRLFTLLEDTGLLESLDSSTATRVRFGTALAGGQAFGQCRWVFYSHLSVARVQSFVPAPFRRPYGVFLHGIEAWQPLAPPQRRVLQGAALRVANSHFTADRVLEANPDAGPILVCPLTVEPEETPHGATIRDARVPPGTPTVLIVARMLSAERYKGHDALLEAWPVVKAHLPGARLVCVGDGDDAPRLQQKAHELGLGGETLFTGFVSTHDLQDWYANASVFAMPSRGEGFGLVYLEAMSHGLPCIGSVHDAAGEIIDDGVTGHLVNQSDPRELGAVLLGLLTNQERRREMGAAGLHRFQRDFSYEAFSRRVISLLEDTFLAADAAEASEATTR